MVNKTEREMIIRLRKQKKTVSEISILLCLKRSTVGFWVKRYNDSKSLKNLPRSGRPTALTKSKLLSVKKLVHVFVRSAEENHCCVSSKELKQLIDREVGSAYSLRHVQRLLHKLGLTRTTPRSQHIKHDQEKVDAFRDEFKKNWDQSTWTIQ